MSKKLVIKINNLQSIDEDELAKKHEVEQLLWGRILAVVAVAGVAIALTLGWFFQGSDEVQIQVAQAEFEKKSVQATPEVQIKAPDEEVASKTVLSEPPAPREAVNPDESEGKTIANGGELPQAEGIVAVAVSPEKTVPTPAPGEVNDASETKEVVTEEAFTEMAQAQPALVQILDDGIAEAQLTSSLSREKTPEDALGYNVIMGKEDLIRVYLYTQLQGIEGKTLYHSWFRNGERMARVRIPVISDNYRASSSKFIDRWMLGDWQVEIADETGMKYAQVSFKVSD